MNHFYATKTLSTSLRPAGSQGGLDFAGLCDEPALEGFEPLAELTESLEQSELGDRPSWDRTRRVLMFAAQVIKRFNWPARNQELILTAFEEMGWPDRIDDPLPVTEGISQKDRLHDTIKCLNRKRLIKSIRFTGDGTGQGVCWRRSDEAGR